jgi:hypothetical protein
MLGIGAVIVPMGAANIVETSSTTSYLVITNNEYAALMLALGLVVGLASSLIIKD